MSEETAVTSAFNAEIDCAACGRRFNLSLSVDSPRSIASVRLTGVRCPNPWCKESFTYEVMALNTERPVMALNTKRPDEIQIVCGLDSPIRDALTDAHKAFQPVEVLGARYNVVAFEPTAGSREFVFRFGLVEAR